MRKDKKKKFPTILKRCFADYLESIDKYQLSKYLNKSHIIDLIRVTHPRSKKNQILKEPIKTGKVTVEEDEQTWEKLRSEKKTWKEIVDILHRIPHMALLRNLRGIIIDSNDPEFLQNIIAPMLCDGVKGGKQFPFRYMSALDEINKIDNDHKTIIVDSLSQCLEIAMDSYPQLEGKTLCLCDNSGSAWGSFTSTFGTMIVAKIANLSGIMTAKNCTKQGYVGVFGDDLIMIEVDKNKPVLEQVNAIHDKGKIVGAGTENGIWIFFRDAFQEAKQYKKYGKPIDETMLNYFDNIFIYSDMQCGHGGLYGRDPKEYYEYVCNGRNINVIELIKTYRELINPKVNIYSVQVAGYKDTVIPEMLYRCHILSGWCGFEVIYAVKMNKIMDEIDSKQ